MHVKKFALPLLLLLLTLPASSQEVLTLDTCRARALRANRGLKQAEAKVQKTDALEKAAFCEMLPRVTANGGYMWMEKSVNLLSEEQKERLSTMGDEIQSDISSAIHQEMSGFNLDLGGLSIPVGDALAGRLDNALTNANLSGKINEMGNEIINGMTTDTRNMGGAMITVTQPIYLGGKLLAAHRTAALVHSLAGVELDKKQQETVIAVDEAYWQVVSVEYKKSLAEQYAALLDTLEHNVQLLVDAEMATQGDLAQVRVKHNEAQMSLTKATNGLMLSKMLLAERCGMPLDSDIEVVTMQNDQRIQDNDNQGNQTVDMNEVWFKRPEMHMLRIADSVARQGVRMAASTLKPNVAVSGGYLLTNPNVFDGFKNEWGGTWMAGVVVNVPIVHPAGIYAVKAAKAKRNEVAYQMEEAEEMIALQVKKLSCELEIAYKHLAQAESDLDAAENNLKLADESFKAGMCSSSDLMAAQTAWMKAESEIIDARIEIEMDKVYLKQALGN
jgi:outer membrane protein TolC